MGEIVGGADGRLDGEDDGMDDMVGDCDGRALIVGLGETVGESVGERVKLAESALGVAEVGDHVPLVGVGWFVGVKVPEVGVG
jgi:hypothetical protein